MHKAILAFALTSSSFVSASMQENHANEVPHGKVVAAYFADWQYFHPDKPYNVKNIPAESLTHIIYAFLSMCGPHEYASKETQGLVKQQCKGKKPFTAIVVDKKSALTHDFGPVEADVNYKGHFAQLAQLKLEHPEVKILPSFGGWTMSEPFHEMAKDPNAIKHFAYSAAELIERYSFFDGIDINWEYPGGGGLTTQPWNPATKLLADEMELEKTAYTALVQHLRDALDELGAKHNRYYTLTTAGGVADKAPQIDWPAVAPNLDHIFAMTFDYLGGWAIFTGHSANLHATERSVWGMGTDVFIQQLLDLDVPPEKIVMGTTQYGRGWEGTKNYHGEPPSETLMSARGAQFGTGENGYFQYWDIIENYGEKQGFQSHFDKESQAAYLWHPKDKIFISYENEQALRAKVKWAKANGLGGVFSWELSGDPSGKLMRALYDEMHSAASLPE
ncbi:glycoside hydrolase family 18 protein [Vibrio agarilyticus]|uniref:glycoside hydrolase family 18 protein n=1 Tax=Vibrio agarilyticus TaxID=2726741 RepID=UPI003F6DB105